MIWIGLLAGLLLAAFGATAASALLTVSRMQIARAGPRELGGGSRALAWLGQVEHYLTAAGATTSLGVVLVGATVPALLAGYRLPAVALVAALVVVPFVLFGGYLVPRWVVQPRAERVAAAVVPVLRPWAAFMGMLLPARSPTRPSELRAVLREGAAAGLATDEELRLVGGVMSFAERPVREVMTPRTEVVAIPEDADLREISAVFGQSGYSRIPVYRGTLDEIVGMLHAFDLFKLRPGDPLPVRPVAVAPASRNCGDLLLDMQRERRHLAIVIDEHGGTLGLVTMEDLLEELVGEIFDEHDVPGDQGGAAPAVFETDGATPTGAIEERFGVHLPSGRTTTIGGLLGELAGRVPAAGERLLLRGLEFDILQASPTRIERLIVRPAPVPVIPLGKSGP